MLHLARTSPLSDGLDLRNHATKPENADYYWIGDADPDKVRLYHMGSIQHSELVLTHLAFIPYAQVSDEEIEAFIRKYGQCAAHPVSLPP